MKLVVAEVQAGVDGLVGLKVNVDLLLLPLVGKDGAAVDDETILGHPVVKLELLLGRSDGTEHRETIHAVLDV